MNKWFFGVKNTDIGKNCKVSGVPGKVIAVNGEGISCTIRNKNGKVHCQKRSNVMVSRAVDRQIGDEENEKITFAVYDYNGHLVGTFSSETTISNKISIGKNASIGETKKSIKEIESILQEENKNGLTLETSLTTEELNALQAWKEKKQAILEAEIDFEKTMYKHGFDENGNPVKSVKNC